MISINDFFELLEIAVPEDADHYRIETAVDGANKTITLSTVPTPCSCPQCGSPMHSKGIYQRKVKHPVLQDGTLITVLVNQRRWKCSSKFCSYTQNEEFPFLTPRARSTNMTPMMILNAMKDLSRSTASVARQFNVSDTHVHDLFTAYVDLPRLTLPKILSIDEVYMDMGEGKKYQLVLMDFQTGQIVDILENRYRNTMQNYLSKIPKDERDNVEYLISDAYNPYIEICYRYFPNAKHILDSFHVVQKINNDLNLFINKVMRKYQEKQKKELQEINEYTLSDQKTVKDSQEIVLLRNYRWIMLKNKNEINYSPYPCYHKMLKMRLTAGQIEQMFFALHPAFKQMRDLKEKYIQFNQMHFDTEEAASKELDALIKLYTESDHAIFKNMALYLTKFRQSIVHSFVDKTVTRSERYKEVERMSRLSSGPIESFNRTPKDMKRLGRGMKNFEYIRNRILWANRKNPPIRSIPKRRDQIHSFSLDKKAKRNRPSTYNKKK